MRARQESCCFTGHRPAKLPWRYNEEDGRCLALKRRIADTVEAAYDQGYRHFLCGMAQGCDLYFCECVLALRERRPDVTVEAAIPCPTQADGWPAALRERYDRLVAACDFETLVSARYSSSCMQRRDRYMVDHASLLIAAFDGSPGGTRYTVEYAMRRGVSVVDLAVSDFTGP
nr:SLOG family protein [uncultured Dysosmobacter sp.]